MNRMLYFLTALLFVFACDDDEQPNTALHGKWLLVEQKIGTGPPGVWEPAANSDTILELKSDSTFTTTVFPDCAGTYAVKGDLIAYKLDCSGQLFEWTDRFTLDTDLYLSPTGPHLCDEGCEYKYRRI